MPFLQKKSTSFFRKRNIPRRQRAIHGSGWVWAYARARVDPLEGETVRRQTFEDVRHGSLGLTRNHQRQSTSGYLDAPESSQCRPLCRVGSVSDCLMSYLVKLTRPGPRLCSPSFRRPCAHITSRSRRKLTDATYGVLFPQPRCENKITR